MCTHKITVTNPTKSFTEGSTKHKITVPCGHCDECNLNKAKDWSLRYWQEISDYRAAGGRVAFVTFTYSPEYLPRFTFRDEKNDVYYSIPCFDKSHVKAYNMYIRTHFYQKYGLTSDIQRTATHNSKGLPLKTMSLPFKYAWHCEYGTDNTHRSHLHTLFFLPPEMCDTPELRGENNAKHFFRQAWKYGWTIFSKDYGLWVTTEFAADYVGKYCFKDWHWFDQPQVHDFLFSEGELDKERMKMLNDVRPNHWNSKGMGKGLVDVFDDEEKFFNGVDFMFLKNLRKGINVNQKPPQYIERKILYNQLPDGRYILNDKGVQWKCNHKLQQIYNDADMMAQDFSPEGLRKLVDSPFIERKFADYQIHSHEDLSKYITSILNGRSFLEVSVYRQVWQGHFVRVPLVASAYYPPIFKTLDKLSIDELLDISLDKYHAQLDATRSPDFFSSENGYFFLDNVKKERHKYKYFSLCNRFDRFEEICYIQDLIRSEYTYNYTKKYLSDFKHRKEIKRIINLKIV